MRSFSDQPIKLKLTVLIVATSLSVLVAAGIALFSYERIGFQDEIVNRISDVADIVGANSAAALEFDDVAIAEKTLATLSGREHILAAVLYRNGAPFASFPPSKTFAEFPRKSDEQGHRFEGGQLILFRPIVFKDRPIGTVYIRASLDELNSRLTSHVLILVAILLCAVVLSFGISALLQRFISAPIVQLVDTVKSVAERRDYSLRAPSFGKDEMGQLIDGFNEMLAQIQTRDGALRDSEDLFRTMFELSGVGNYQAAPDTGRLLRVNRKLCEITGYSRDEMLAMSSKDLTHTGFIERETALSTDLKPGPQSVSTIEERFVCKDGRSIWVSVTATMMRDASGKPLFTQAAILDVTDRVRAQEEIRALNANLERRVLDRTAQLESAIKELEAFSYSVSHDLRAPLRSIDGFSRIIEDRYGAQLDATAKEYFGRVRNATQRMGQLIDDMLMLSRVTRSEMRHDTVKLSEMAEIILSDLRARDPNRKVESSVEKDLVATGDPHLLQIVLENLLGNAWKYSSKRERAKIEFGLFGSNEERTFFVRDNGAGFDMAFVAKLFNPFSRLHTVSEFPGSGIGLAIINRIIARHGGKIWVEAAVEKGATFFFRI